MTAEDEPRCDDVAVVIRSVGERTEAACRALVERQVPASRVTVIRVQPFSEALRRGFEIGSASGLPWTFCLDADVLLRPGALARLLRCAATLPPTLFELEGRVADKLLGQRRAAGQHLYRTALLQQALQTDICAAVLRPETEVKKQMAQRGYPWREVDLLMGLHDFEQSYVDVYRKALVHCRKHWQHMDYAARFWRRQAATDADFLAAVWALKTLELFDGDITIDRGRFPHTLETFLSLAGMREKPPLAADQISPQRLEQTLRRFAPAPEFIEERRFRQLYRRGRVGRARAVLYRYGALGSLPHLAARLSGAAGVRLETAALALARRRGRGERSP